MKVKNDHLSTFSNLRTFSRKFCNIDFFNDTATTEIYTLSLHDALPISGIAEVTGLNPVEALIFFRLLLSNCLNWKIYFHDHSSLSSTTAVQI